MLYLAIPAQNEVATIGVLLWRLRTVLAEFPREYEVVVYDDASTDETADVAEQYASAMPVTVLRGTAPVGYAGAVDALVRYVSAATRYPRRDALLLLQGDFTDPPGIVPEFARRFEGGADLVVGERTAVVDAPVPVKRLFSVAGWALRPFVRVDGVKDLTGSMRLIRVSVLRDLLRGVDNAPVCEGDTWTANADFLLRLVPHARRIESVPMEPTYGVRMRETRRATMRDGLASLRWGWRARGRRVLPVMGTDAASDRNRDRPDAGRDAVRDNTRDGGRDDQRESAVPSRDGRSSARERSREPRRRGEKVERERDTALTVDALAEPLQGESGPRDRQRPEGASPGRGAKKGTRAGAGEGGRGAKQDRASNARNGDARDDAKSARPLEPAGEVFSKRNSGDAGEMLLDDPFAAPRGVADEGVAESERLDAAVPGTTASAERSPYRSDSPEDDRSDPAFDEERGSSETTEMAADPEAPVRKRRRNRRSRRRRNAAEGSPSEASSGDAASGDATSGDAASGDDSAGDDFPGEDAPALDDSADSGDSGDSSSEANGGDDSAEASSRRRGRRGRRGGARRSRGRGKRGDAAGEAPGEGSTETPE